MITTTTTPRNVRHDPTDFWNHPVSIVDNNFIYKSLSEWSCNIAVGCEHACRFCYVPSVSTNKMAETLKEHGIDDPDAQWGEYVFVRQFSEKDFLRSLAKAEAKKELKRDGNRAVMLCTTTDPFQVIRHPDPARQKELQAAIEFNTTRALELILEHSSINVRILTRSPLSRKAFPLMKKFGNRLMFGMSIPTLDNSMAKVFEPKASAPTKRLETMHAARAAGLHTFVAMAPTYPRVEDQVTRPISRMDLWATLRAIAEIDPLTIFHEPINIRSENVERIRKNAEAAGVNVNTDVFATNESWAAYAMEQLRDVEQIATQLGLGHRLHLWPDKSLKKHYSVDWLESRWNRVSEWPGKAKQ
jgi:DNA repair photolyase